MNRNSDRHAPNRFSSYAEIHETVMSRFKSRDFVSVDSLEFLPVFGFEGFEGFRLSGEIACLGEIVLWVDKTLDALEEIRGDVIVQTTLYSYNAYVRGYHNIFRYDNLDGDYLRPGHLDEHHRHVFDWRNGTERIGSPYWVGHDDWPTLGDVLQELETWYWQHKDDLPNPDAYPKLGLRSSPPSVQL